MDAPVFLAGNRSLLWPAPDGAPIKTISVIDGVLLYPLIRVEPAYMEKLSATLSEKPTYFGALPAYWSIREPGVWIEVFPRADRDYPMHVEIDHEAMREQKERERRHATELEWIRTHP